MFFENLSVKPIDPIFGIQKKYLEDKRKNKIPLVVGYYQDAMGKTPLMQAIQTSQKKYVEEGLQNIEYLPMKGDCEFISAMKKLIFSDLEEKMMGVQSVGGTGALYVGGRFLIENGFHQVAIPSPTWANHRPIFEFLGLNVVQYDYFDVENFQLRFSSLLKCLEKLKPNTVILLHPSCHNPTGCSLTQEEWKELSEWIQRRKLIPFFDLAYQGLGRGIQEDVWPIQYFLKKGHELLVASTCSKNFSLYSQRIGALFISANSKNLNALESQLNFIIRRTYSNPPEMGAKLVSMILTDSSLRKMWEEELKSMRTHLQRNREKLKNFLEKNLKRNYESLLRQEGLFSYIGLNSEQVEKLQNEHAIYLPKSGRINISALNAENMPVVLKAILEVM